MKHLKTKNKLRLLNFNLKNQILSFLRINFLLTEIPKVCKEICWAIQRTYIYRFLSKNIHYILKDILYDNEFLENFQQKIRDNKIINDNDNFLLNFIEMNDYNYDDLIRFLLLVKYDKFTYFYLKEDGVLNKYSDFLIYSTNIRKIVLKAERYNYETRDYETIFSCLSEILSKNKRINALQFNKGFFENYGDYRGKNFLELICKYPSISTIIIYNNKFEANNANFDIFMEAMKNNKIITDFRLVNCFFEYSFTLKKLAEMVRINKTIENLNLNNLNVVDEFLGMSHIDSLTKAFEGNQTIKSLAIGSECLKDYTDLDSFFNMISKLENLESLEIPGLLQKENSENVPNLKVSNYYLKKLKKLKHLGISQHDLYDNLKTIKAFIKVIKDNNISSLDVSEKFYCYGYHSIITKLKINFSYFIYHIFSFNKLESLNLDCTFIFRDGKFILKTIRKYIHKNQNLKKLTLRYCNILNTKNNLSILSDIVKNNKTLELIDLSNNLFCKNPMNIKILRDISINRNLKIVNDYNFYVY